MTMELTVIVPTRNEEATIDELLTRVDRSLSAAQLDFEVLVVDDSDDETPARVRGRRGAGSSVRLLHRSADERVGGLAGAVQAGIDATSDTRVLAVMDGDLQHPPELLPVLVGAVRDGADVAVASRYVEDGGGVAGLDGGGRRLTSLAARGAARLFLRRARTVEDPLSGFFAVRRDVVAEAPLRASGFKILLEILVRGRWARVREVPLRMERRLGGASKAGAAQGVAYGRQLARLVVAESVDRYRRRAAASSSA